MAEKKDVKKDESKEEKESAPISSSSFVGGLALVIAIACAIGVFYLWNNAAMSEKKFVDLSPQIAQLRLAQANMQNALEQQHATIKSLEESITSLREKSGRDEDGWVLAEVDYIIRIANFNLELDRNIALAIKLLKTADEKIRSLGNPNLSALRMGIQQSIAKLSAIAQVDTEGLVIRLQVLSKTVEALPLAKHEAEKTVPEVAEAEATSEEKTNWQEALKNSLNSIKEMVVIRRLDKPFKALMKPDQHANLIENIQLQLSAAQWAVLHHERKIYEASLKLVKEWIEEYFQAGDQVKSVLRSLDELMNINIDPNIPKIDLQIKGFSKPSQPSRVDVQEKDKESEQPTIQPKQVEVLSS